ncbi:hypothetical protein E4T56_gene9339, partial [Termitomyces sp. T112]
VYFAATTAGRSWPGQVIEADARASSGAEKTWVYCLTRRSPVDPLRGAAHTDDIPYVFGTLDAPGSFSGTDAGAKATRDALQGAFVKLAKTGEGSWTPYRLPTRATMLMSENPRVENDPRGWERAIDNQRQRLLAALADADIRAVIEIGGHARPDARAFAVAGHFALAGEDVIHLVMFDDVEADGGPHIQRAPPEFHAARLRRGIADPPCGGHADRAMRHGLAPHHVTFVDDRHRRGGSHDEQRRQHQTPPNRIALSRSLSFSCGPAFCPG